jgi:tRNA(fMet)-specific endonuclease VapC
MRRFLLDTGIAQDFINRRHGVVERSDAERRAGNRIGICTPVLGELWAGGRGKRLARAQSPAIAAVPVAAGRLAVHQRRGRAVRSGDCRAAANGAADAADRHHGGGRRVFTRNCTAVSRDTDLEAVPGLTVENWAAGASR